MGNIIDFQKKKKEKENEEKERLLYRGVLNRITHLTGKYYPVDDIKKPPIISNPKKPEPPEAS